MPNAIDAQGIQIQTIDEILDELKNGTLDYPGFYQIYGPSINVEPNSPDGQQLNIWAQGKRDILEFTQNVYNSFDPTQAVGTQLDQRCAINGVFRNAGTRTVVNVTVTVDQALVLPGLDTAPTAPFTVADTSGNQYQLIEAYTFSGSGSAALAFQAVDVGPINPTTFAISVIVTVTLGVSNVSNLVGSTVSVGTNEETDAALRIRRARSVSLPSLGFYDGLYGALLGVEGVTSVNLLENVTNTIDANSIPGHSIWAIVAGGTDADVAQQIYVKRNAGCGMKGGVSVNITQADGSIFEVLFDRPTSENLWVSMEIHPITGTIDTTYIKDQILANFSYGIGQTADATAITAFVKGIAPNASVESSGVSDDGVTYGPLLDTTGPNYQFILDPARVSVVSV